MAALTGAWFADRYFKQHSLNVDMPPLMLTVVIAGLLGAKLDAICFGSPSLSVARRTGFEGYSFLGGFIVASFAAFGFRKVYKLPWKAFDGIFCTGIAYAIGRIGCFLAGDGDYGTATNLPWGVAFPRGLVPTMLPVHPTMLYSAVWESCLFAGLWVLSKPKQRPTLWPGALLGMYLLGTGAGRFGVEFISINPVLAFGLKESQLISLLVMSVGIAVLCASHSKHLRHLQGITKDSLVSI